jgi:hypothetical protein
VTGRHFAALNDQPLPQCCIQLIQSSGCRMAGAAIERAARSMIPPQELESPVWHRQPIDELCIAEQRSVLPLLQSSYPRMPRRTDGRGPRRLCHRSASGLFPDLTRGGNFVFVRTGMAGQSVPGYRSLSEEGCDLKRVLLSLL